MIALEINMLDQFRKNYEYDYWANDKFLKALMEMPQPPEKAVKLLGHIFFALEVWLARLKNEDLSRFTDPNPLYTLAECGQKLDALHLGWKNYLACLAPKGLKGKVTYKNTKGEGYELLVQNVLVHVVNHNHYHRGQMAMLVAQAEGKRPSTDYSNYTFEIGEAKAI